MVWLLGDGVWEKEREEDGPGWPWVSLLFALARK